MLYKIKQNKTELTVLTDAQRQIKLFLLDECTEKKFPPNTSI